MVGEPARPALSGRLAFVGRGPKREALLDRLEAAFTGQAGCALIAGEPGIGWSRLAESPADHADVLAPLSAPVRYELRPDRGGYVQLRRWRVNGQRALVRQDALAWLSAETLTVVAGRGPAYCSLKVNGRGERTAVTEPRLLPTRYQARQPRLWPRAPNSAEWQLALQAPARERRGCRRPEASVRGRLPETAATG